MLKNVLSRKIFKSVINAKLFLCFKRLLVVVVRQIIQTGDTFTIAEIIYKMNERKVLSNHRF